MNPEQLEVFARIEDRHWWFVARRRIVTQLVHQIAPPGRASTILDIGCGTGGNIGCFQDEYRCFGVDAASTAISLASARFPRVTFQCDRTSENGRNLSADADLIMMMDVIEHVADDFLFVSELLAAARSGTRMLLTVPADMSLWSKHDETVLHYRRYDLSRFKAVWEGLPFRVLLLSHFNSRLYPLIKATRQWNRRRGESFGFAGMDFVMPNRVINNLLTRIFAGEAARLVRMLHSRACPPYRHGVSLMAVLERTAGAVAVRHKPSSLPHDPFVPGQAAA